MAELLTTSNVMFVLGVGGVVFSIFQYFNNPQKTLEKDQAVDRAEVDGKAGILAQQVQWEKEVSAKRFDEMGARVDTAMTLAQNHIHTVETKVDSLGKDVAAMSREIVRLATIIDERIPRQVEGAPQMLLK